MGRSTFPSLAPHSVPPSSPFPFRPFLPSPSRLRLSHYVPPSSPLSFSTSPPLSLPSSHPLPTPFRLRWQPTLSPWGLFLPLLFLLLLLLLVLSIKTCSSSSSQLTRLLICLSETLLITPVHLLVLQSTDRSLYLHIVLYLSISPSLLSLTRLYPFLVALYNNCIR